MKIRRCNLCGSDNNKLLYNSYVRCNKCGFVFTDGILNKQKSLYDEKYFHIEDFKDKAKVGYRSYEKDRAHHKYYFGKKLDLIKKYLPASWRGKILDVGCALGFFMERALEFGYDPYGIDVSKYAVSYASKKFPKKVFCGDLKKAKFQSNFFDGVTLFQTIEHLDNPLETVKEAGRILKRRGYLVIATPNHNCIVQKVLGKHWFEYKPAEHLGLFDAKTIKYLLDKSGFSLIEIKEDIFYYPVNYILERIAYYSPFKILNKIAINNNFRIPLPLGGMIVLAQKI